MAIETSADVAPLCIMMMTDDDVIGDGGGDDVSLGVVCGVCIFPKRKPLPREEKLRKVFSQKKTKKQQSITSSSPYYKISH